MLLITKRRQIGTICGHTIYAVSRSEMIPLSNPAVRSNIAISKNENRFLVNFVPCCLFLSATVARNSDFAHSDFVALIPRN